MSGLGRDPGLGEGYQQAADESVLDRVDWGFEWVYNRRLRRYVRRRVRVTPTRAWWSWVNRRGRR